ncbi:MAG TPA: adenylate/guanylate cyclase domain-containing protein [Usitatibacter sp.]|nr:adenylate/guanylate cyclase domain-containing protein [Usitatibacter sp.]
MSEEHATAERVTRRLSAVLFVDLMDSVRLIQADPEGTVARWRDFVAAASREDLPAARGRMVKHTGDGMLLEFESIVDGVRCALALQSRIERGNAGLAPERQLHLRMGAHVADVIVDDIDLYGDGVNLAARLMALGGPGEIVISSVVRDQLSDGLGLTVEDLGERNLKGMQRPVRAFRAWPAAAAVSQAAIDRRRRLGDRPSVAVLPFRTVPSPGAHDFLGDLLAEELIGHLSRLTDLFVISRLSTTPFRDRLYEPRDVGEVLGVRYVLSGSILVSGTNIQVMAELTEADVGQVIWSERFRGTVADLFDILGKMAPDIAKRVVPHVRQRELQRARSKGTETLTAYERMLRGVDHFHRSSREDLQESRRMLEAAIRSEPSYAIPYAWLAQWYVRHVGQGWTTDARGDAAEARRLSAEAMVRDDTSSLVLTVAGLVSGYLDKDLQTSIGLFDRALQINPSEVSAWGWSTGAQAWLGEGVEAMRRSHRAMDLSPFDPRMYTFITTAAMAHIVGGQYEKSVELCRWSLRLNRMYTATHRSLVIALTLAGRVDEASKAAADLMSLEPALTVARFRERYPGNRSPHADTMCEALATAGVPRA